MIKRVIKPYTEVIEKLGCQLVETHYTGKSHYKLVVASGPHRHFFVASNSPSDRRSVLNFASDVRRWLREVEHGH